MSVAQIMTFFHNHQGANSNKPISHQEVLGVIAAAKNDRKMPTIAARCLLLQAAFEFGGNMVHPQSLFSSPGDREAFIDSAMEGIETAAKFGRLSKRSQIKFIKFALWLDLGTVADFSSSAVSLSSITGNVADRINAILQSQRLRAGNSYVQTPITNLVAYVRNGGAYGYDCTALWPTANGNGGNWVAEFLLDQSGDALIEESEYEPPDDD
jgi:hypothetical protein